MKPAWLPLAAAVLKVAMVVLIVRFLVLDYLRGKQEGE